MGGSWSSALPLGPEGNALKQVAYPCGAGEGAGEMGGGK